MSSYEELAAKYASSGAAQSTNDGGKRLASVAIAYAILHLAKVIQDKNGS